MSHFESYFSNLVTRLVGFIQFLIRIFLAYVQPWTDISR